ncbi:hypothetical protein CEXT_207751 [Caerostris extrusa]|uniref:Uncharacterized protein n=1 Tax=Caerostris extrusa TaxID=172846 RepID=A0AAV4Q2X7_CAEEX|nr:hypothetical protein CEXT_207751 [Caerostris extrusa]
MRCGTGMVNLLFYRMFLWQCPEICELPITALLYEKCSIVTKKLSSCVFCDRFRGIHSIKGRSILLVEIPFLFNPKSASSLIRDPSSCNRNSGENIVFDNKTLFGETRSEVSHFQSKSGAEI